MQLALIKKMPQILQLAYFETYQSYCCLTNVAKCNLGKVNLKAMLVGGFLIHTLWGRSGALSGMPHDSYMQLLACSVPQTVNDFNLLVDFYGQIWIWGKNNLEISIVENNARL